jgi:regulator of protease activity HflC (stomatin/prohibitin superfamily)
MTRFDDEVDDEHKRIIRIISGGVVTLGIIILFFSTFYIINAGYSGVLTTFGKVNSNAVSPGLHVKVPIIQGIISMEVRTQKYEADASASSSDLQVVTAKIATNYHLVPETVPTLYNDIGLGYSERVIQPLEQEAVKSVTAQYTAEELITKREEVRQEIKTLMTTRLQPRGIIVEEVSIVNFDFSPSFNQAIEAKVVQEQASLAAKNKLQQIQFEAQQKITAAEAEAKALELQKSQITPELLQLRQIEVQSKALDVQLKAIDKWSGTLPLYTGGVIPFLDIGVVASK